MISGYATSKGTAEFAQKFGKIPQNYNIFENLTFSNVGVGTYLGEADDQTDIQVINATKKSILEGINVIDTAINYRAQKAERAVGKAILELVENHTVNRDQIFISTKNGYLTNDADIKEDFWTYVQREYVKPGIILAGDISSGYHCMTVKYLEDQLQRSRKNLGLDCIDLMYLHNAVESQPDVPREQFMTNLQQVFEMYEQKRKEGLIRYYGMATWDCFRVKKDNPSYLSLYEVFQLATKAGGKQHGFKFIQLPYNLYYDQAHTLKNQPLNGSLYSVLEAAKLLGVGVFTSVPLFQGRLLGPGVIPRIMNETAAVECIQFVRSTPGVLAPLVGHKQPQHVDENLQIMKIPPLSKVDFENISSKFSKS